MVDEKIPRPIKDLIKVFYQNNFRKMTIKELAHSLKQEENTISQRIIRDKGEYLESDDGRPKKIWL
ncbi:MAG: hypothetical protein ACFFCS_22580, partial [Candidatus Hodarchaeota archaeon]